MKIKTILTLMILSFFLISCSSLPESEAVTYDELKGSAWISSLCGMPEEGKPGFEGFYLAEDGSLQFINIFSMTGHSWTLEGDELILKSSTERYPDPTESRYRVRKIDGLIKILLPLTHDQADEPEMGYRMISDTSLTPEGRWGISILPNPESLDVPYAPQDKEPFLEINTENGLGIHGFASVNIFNASLSLEGQFWSLGPVMSTMMAGPYLDYEHLFLSVLEQADSYLSIEGFLFLYKENTALMILKDLD